MKNYKILLAGLIALSPMVANAGLIVYDWSWTGTSGYTAAGTMSYDDSLAGTGVITASSISTFTIEGFQGASSLFTWDLATDTQGNPFQLSFDTTALSLVFGGYYPTASDSVVWGNDQAADGGALICGTANCGLRLGGAGLLGPRSVSDTTQFLFVQRTAPVPEPGILALLGLGLAGLGVARRRRL